MDSEMPTELEIEAKYAILGPLNPATLAELDLGQYHLHPDGESHHQDVLLDTPQRAITSDGHTLRIRFRGDQATLNLKGPNQGTGGMHEREECEAPLPARADADYEYRRWPEPIAGRVATLAGEEPLAPLVKVYIHRRQWSVLRDAQTVGELVLDQGVINAGGRTARVHELEVELKGVGSRADLRALDRRLLELLPLQPQPRGKSQRGLALLARNRTLDGHTPLRAVSLHMLRKYVRRVRASEPAARTSADPERVHEMRVAIRRLRTALRLLEDSMVFEEDELRAMRRRLRIPARALGAVRDADVLLKRIEDYRAAHPDSAARLEPLAHAVRRRRKVARKRLTTYLKSKALARTLARLDHLNEGSPTGAIATLFVRHFAGSAIWRGYERILRYETVVAAAPPATLHRLRIACKCLRYTLEFFASELGKATQPLVRLLIKAQDALGDLRDATAALDAVTDLLHKHPANRELAAYAAALAGECAQLRGAFTPIWGDLSDAGISQELAELVAAL